MTMLWTALQDPGEKGNTAQGGATKPAILETGAEIKVPLFISVRPHPIMSCYI